jgi:mRNA interferase HicA
MASRNDKRKPMSYNEFRRWLKSQGATFVPAKGSHFKVTLNGVTTVFPDHGKKEIGKGLVEKIKKDLEIK